MYNIILKKHIMYISGSVIFPDIMSILNIFNKIVARDFNKIIVNLRFLEYSNTSMLLLMISFIKIAFKKEKKIKFINVPDFLIELSRVYNLNKILYNYKFRRYYVKREN